MSDNKEDKSNPEAPAVQEQAAPSAVLGTEKLEAEPAVAISAVAPEAAVAAEKPADDRNGNGAARHQFYSPRLVYHQHRTDDFAQQNTDEGAHLDHAIAANQLLFM